MTHKTTDLSTRTPLKAGGELRFYSSNKPGHTSSIMKGYDCDYYNPALG